MTIKVGQVAARMKAVETATVTGSRVSVAAAAQKAKTVIQAGSPSSLRGVGAKGAKLGVRYTLSGTASNTSAQLRATGPWQLIESDTSAHEIRPKRNRRNRRGRGGGVFIPGIGVRRVVHHPGTKGKHPWAKGVERAEPVVAKEMSSSVTKVAVAAFRG